jgi:hypothetical protein
MTGISTVHAAQRRLDSQGAAQSAQRGGSNARQASPTRAIAVSNIACTLSNFDFSRFDSMR